jgi:hypothetical protein
VGTREAFPRIRIGILTALLALALLEAKWKGYTALVVGCALAIPILRTWIIFAEGAARGSFPDIWSGVAQLWRIALVGYLGMIA